MSLLPFIFMKRFLLLIFYLFTFLSFYLFILFTFLPFYLLTGLVL